MDQLPLAHPELEFFLLSLVSECVHDLTILEVPNLGEAVNRCVPRFSRSELIETLFELFTAGELEARRSVSWRIRHPRPRPVFVPTREEIDAGLCGAAPLRFQLTPQGGARWEQMSAFDWHSYVGGGSDGTEGETEGLSREVVEAYHFWVGPRIVPGSRRWSVIRPWRATYWKTFPRGVRMKYREREAPYAPEKPVDLWSGAWNRRRQAELRHYVPSTPSRETAPVPATIARWRARLKRIAECPGRRLRRQLDSAQDPAVQYAAAMCLAQTNDPAHVPALAAWVEKTRKPYAIRAMAGVLDPRVLASLLSVFRGSDFDPSFGDRTLVARLSEAIASFGDSAVPMLAALLPAAPVHQQMAVLGSLGATGSRQAGSAILEWLETLERDTGPEYGWRVSSAFNALAALKEPRALPAMELILHHEPDWVIEALTRFDHPEARRMLEQHVGSEGSLHRRWRALHRMAEADPSLHDACQRLRHDLERQALIEAARKLTYGRIVAIGLTDNPIAGLVEVLRSPDFRKRVDAITLIAQLEDEPFPESAVAALLRDPVAEVRANAVYALGKRGGQKAAALLGPMARDRSGLVRFVTRLGAS